MAVSFRRHHSTIALFVFGVALFTWWGYRGAPPTWQVECLGNDLAQEYAQSIAALRGWLYRGFLSVGLWVGLLTLVTTYTQLGHATGRWASWGRPIACSVLGVAGGTAPIAEVSGFLATNSVACLAAAIQDPDAHVGLNPFEVLLNYDTNRWWLGSVVCLVLSAAGGALSGLLVYLGWRWWTAFRGGSSE